MFQELAGFLRISDQHVLWDNRLCPSGHRHKTSIVVKPRSPATSSDAHFSQRRKLCPKPVFLLDNTPPRSSSPRRTHLSGISLQWPPLPGKVIKAIFLLHPKLSLHFSLRQWTEAEFRRWERTGMGAGREHNLDGAGLQSGPRHARQGDLRVGRHSRRVGAGGPAREAARQEISTPAHPGGSPSLRPSRGSLTCSVQLASAHSLKAACFQSP